jgi:beta-phosphoglucomutase
MIPVAMRALIFDFDGVLADTEELHCTAFQAAVAGIGLTLVRDRYFQRYLGLPDRDCLAAVCAQAGRRVTPAELQELFVRKRAAFARVSRDAQLYPGVAETLRGLHADFTLAIASGAFRDEIEPILTRAGVRHLFAALVGADDVRTGKPSPEPFLRALEMIRHLNGIPVTAEECLVIEDSPNGVQAARAAGMRCVAVTTHHDRATLAAADAVIEHVTQLRAEDLK